MKKELKFVFTFLIFASLFYIIISIFYSKDLPVIGTSSVAFTLNNILTFFGIETVLVDNVLHLPKDISLTVILECTGVYEIIILSSIILSYPTDVKKKLYGIISGIIVIYILNMLRLISISYVLVYYTDKFDFIDRYLWQVSLVIFISLTYTMWLKLIERSDSL